jgi:hypothetical protein
LGGFRAPAPVQLHRRKGPAPETLHQLRLPGPLSAMSAQRRFETLLKSQILQMVHHPAMQA